MEYNIVWMELLEILKSNRNKLVEFILANGDYDVIKQILLDIEENVNNISIVRDLFLGNYGFEYYKQKSIYELPTNQLINIIIGLCDLLGVFEIEEIMGGQGLLSSILKNRTTLDIKCTDANIKLETMGLPKYIEIERKHILEYMNETNDDKLYISTWINDYEDYIRILKQKTIKQMLLIGNLNLMNEFIDKIKTIPEYKIFYLQGKQICYMDYFKFNHLQNLNNNPHCRSSLILIAKDIDLTEQLIKTYVGHENFTDFIKYDDRYLLQDLVIKRIIPKWSVDILLEDNEDKKKELIKMVQYFISKKIKLPKFIKNFENLVFLYNTKLEGYYPNNINNYKKFIEYKNYYEKTVEYVYPEWINGGNEEKVYLFLEFSSPFKTWKANRTNFLREARLYF